jgi:hypothetical protein
MEPRAQLQWPRNLFVVMDDDGHQMLRYQFADSQIETGAQFAKEIRRVRNDQLQDERIRAAATKIRYSPTLKLWIAPIESLGVILWLNDVSTNAATNVVLPVSVSHGTDSLMRNVVDFEHVEANWRKLIIEEEAWNVSCISLEEVRQVASESLQRPLPRRPTKRQR